MTPCKFHNFRVCFGFTRILKPSGAPPAIPDCIPEEDNCSEEDSEGADHSYLPPEVFALTWHAEVGHIMHMAPRIAYIIHLIRH